MTYVLHFGSNCSMKNMAVGRNSHFRCLCCPCFVHRRPQVLLSTLKLRGALKSFRAGDVQKCSALAYLFPGFQEGRAELEQHQTLPGNPIALSFTLMINSIVQINKTVSVQSNNAEESPHKRKPEEVKKMNYLKKKKKKPFRWGCITITDIRRLCISSLLPQHCHTNAQPDIA